MQQAQETKEAQREVERLARDQRELHKQTSRPTRRGRNRIKRPRSSRRSRSRLKPCTEPGQTGAARSRAEAGPAVAAFKWALDQAGRRMEGAKRNLEQRNPGADTQRQQENAAQTLERIARALQQQSDGQQQQAEQQQSGQQGGAEQQQAQAQGELQLAREMQAQIRQETASVEQRRSQNQTTGPREQEREIDQLAKRSARPSRSRSARQTSSSPNRTSASRSRRPPTRWTTSANGSARSKRMANQGKQRKS